ncbi:MAG: nuclear transport factor 2 family protein [candidate division KSB1 bacterium]|nr:nuclear transport factor 2 family protein [candidate division KSB1 bacterium]MDZ7274736.1 nuclear transport factor 2 family protein [candidate division KSB1 bacterium]MDZ7285561.1 nuclear transport factor 2 family protein [candidate division KSB1 bacterium]MDZ7298593.1 nuclear transport factor 2 family protein [candidate division KSB1 bacterium]MDZ7306772.1 nuclear transport factor 2 family protein [candidate division KSB1 bacterium]
MKMILAFWFLLHPSIFAAPDDSSRVAAVLDDLHAAAAQADADRYFRHFAPNAVFLGTDPGERWTLAEFRAFALPYFAQGRGWTYTVQRRHIQLGPGRQTAWFDEMLRNESYGLCRGSGVLVKSAGEWKIAQYNLSIPIPNHLARQIVAIIRQQEQK